MVGAGEKKKLVNKYSIAQLTGHSAIPWYDRCTTNTLGTDTQYPSGIKDTLNAQQDKSMPWSQAK